MKPSFYLYLISAATGIAAVLTEVHEKRKDRELWETATKLDGNESSSSQSSPPQPESQPTTSE